MNSLRRRSLAPLLFDRDLLFLEQDREYAHVVFVECACARRSSCPACSSTAATCEVGAEHQCRASGRGRECARSYESRCGKYGRRSQRSGSDDTGHKYTSNQYTLATDATSERKACRRFGGTCRIKQAGNQARGERAGKSARPVAVGSRG